MAAAPLPTLCDGLADLASSFERFTRQDGQLQPLTSEEARRYLNLIKALQNLARLQERELGALRMLVGDIPGRVETATPIEGDNIIRPNFRGNRDE